MFGVLIYSSFKYAALVNELQDKISLTKRWNGRVGKKDLEIALQKTRDEAVIANIKMAILCRNVEDTTLGFGLALYIIIMLFVK